MISRPVFLDLRRIRQPVGAIAERCREAGVIFHTDATQWVGKMPTNVDTDHIDLMSWSGHKMYGPMGIGVLAARPGWLARLRLVLQDRPGSLLRVAQVFYRYNVNIIEIYHQRIFTTLPAKGLITDIECEARDAEQVERLVEGLRAKGYTVQLVELG